MRREQQNERNWDISAWVSCHCGHLKGGCTSASCVSLWDCADSRSAVRQDIHRGLKASDGAQLLQCACLACMKPPVPPLAPHKIRNHVTHTCNPSSGWVEQEDQIFQATWIWGHAGLYKNMSWKRRKHEDHMCPSKPHLFSLTRLPLPWSYHFSKIYSDFEFMNRLCPSIKSESSLSICL